MVVVHGARNGTQIIAAGRDDQGLVIVLCHALTAGEGSGLLLFTSLYFKSIMSVATGGNSYKVKVIIRHR